MRPISKKKLQQPILQGRVYHRFGIFSLTPVKPPFFWLGWTRLNGTISPSYPEVPLDNFGFPVGGRLAARRAVFQPPDRILAILGQSPIAILSTYNFGPKTGQRNLVGPSRPPKKMIHIDNGPGPGRNYGETAIDEEMAGSGLF